MKSHVSIELNKQYCKACGICIDLCPKQVYVPGANGEPSIANSGCCILCGLCEQACPDMAIVVKEAGR